MEVRNLQSRPEDNILTQKIYFNIMNGSLSLRTPSTFLLHIFEMLFLYSISFQFNLIQCCILIVFFQNSFSAAILVTHIFRCFCTLLDTPNIRQILLDNQICNSINRGLKSLANLVKTGVTNFIMQTTRFPECVQAYIDEGVLETQVGNIFSFITANN